MVVKYNHLKALAAKLPGPPTLPLVGNATIFLGNPEEVFKRIIGLTKKYESPSRFWIGTNLVVVVSKPEDIKIVLTNDKTMEKGDMYRCFAEYTGSGLITSPVEQWRKTRSQISKAFDKRLIDNFVPVFNKHNKILVDKLNPFVKRDQFDIWSYMSSTSMDMTYETTLGVDEKTPENLKSEFAEVMSKGYEQILMRCVKLMLPPNIIFKLLTYGSLPSGPLPDKFNSFLNMMIQKKKEERKHNKGQSVKGYDQQKVEGYGTFEPFIETLIKLSDAGANFTDDLIRAEVIETILSSYGTIALTNCYCLLMLALHQDVQEKLYKEISGICKSVRDVIPEHLQQMTYTEMVIKETLRMYPVIPIFLRAVKEDIDLTKHKLPAGCTIAVFPLRTHMDPKIYPHPKKFNPENFTQEKIAKRHRYSYIPFSLGPRMCLGIQLSMHSIKTTLAHLIRNYKFSTDIKSKDIRLKLDLLLRSSKGFPLKIEQRKH